MSRNLFIVALRQTSNGTNPHKSSLGRAEIICVVFMEPCKKHVGADQALLVTQNGSDFGRHEDIQLSRDRCLMRKVLAVCLKGCNINQHYQDVAC